MTIHIYAEHLINIRTLTIQVSLETPSHAGTKATISADGSTLSISHESDIASIELPVNIAGENDKELSIPATPTNDLSLRLRIDNNTGGSLQNSQSSETIIPWTATSLSNQVELRCKECNAVVVPRDKIQIWKDLPSEGWAEMMEFWHCHKPNEPHDHEHQTDKKGYSADSTLAITPSVGLVNATNFIIADTDCQNIKVGLEPFPLFFYCLRTFMAPTGTKRTGAFWPQGYLTWKCRDMSAQEETELRRTSCYPCESNGFSGDANAPLFLQSHRRILQSSDYSKGSGRDMMHRYRLMY